MADRVEMQHPSQAGIARPLADDVPKWEAEGWNVCPARGLAPAKRRASETAKERAKK